MKKLRNITTAILIATLILFATSCEKAPLIDPGLEIEVLSIPDQVLYENFGTISLDLDTVFSDQSGGELTFDAYGTGLLEVTVLDNVITLTELEPAVLTEQITLTAVNEIGLTASAVFNIDIEPSLEYRIIGTWRDGPEYTQIDFSEGTYVWKNLMSGGSTIEGNYTVNNETWEFDWDMDDINRTITLLDTDIDTLRMNQDNGIDYDVFKRIK